MDWSATNYADESWSVGMAKLGYGGEGEVTVLWSGHTAYYFRQGFWLTDTGFSEYNELALRIKYDDGFIAYINGDEVSRTNMPSGIASYDMLALSSHEGEHFEYQDISWFLTDCHTGWNQLTMTLAIEVHQCQGGFEDLSFDAALRAKRTSDDQWVELIGNGTVWSYYDEPNHPPSEESDPVTHIQRPSLNIPVIQTPGGDFEIECLATTGTSDWMAEISTPYLSFALEILNVTTTHNWEDNTSRYLLNVSIPGGVPYELYDLTVEASGELADTSSNAVKVIEEFKSDYYFIHLTDPHIPEHFGPRNIETLEKIIDEINIINPQFVLLTGDGINRGQCEDQHEVLQRILNNFEVPVYFVPGNHELYCWCGDGRERQNFWRYWGWSYLDPNSLYNMGSYTQDYYFDYGTTRYLGLETYFIHCDEDQDCGGYKEKYGSSSCLQEQIDWLEDNLRLDASSSNILFYHHHYYEVTPAPTPSVGWKDIRKVLDNYNNILACLYGHEHTNGISTAGTRPTLMVLTGEAYDETPEDPEEGGFYRLIRVENGAEGGEITHYPLFTADHFNIFFPQNPNNGTRSSVRAVIVNDNDYQFEDGLIRLRVIDDGRSHVVDQGEIIQVIDCGSFLTYYVQINIPAFAEVSVCIYPDNYLTHLVLDGGDYDGDGRSDIAIFRPSIGLWAVRGFTRVYFGSSGDDPVPGDYDGDSTTDIGVFRENSCLWALRNITRLYFGSHSDIPVPGDYDGDGCCDFGIFRGGSGLWAIRGVSRAYFGFSGDDTVPGYYSGNSAKNIGIFRANSGLWALRDVTRVYFGRSEDKAITGDFHGDGTWEIGIFRRGSGLWALREMTRVYFGGFKEQPVLANYGGEAGDDIGVFRNYSGLWSVRGITRVYYGGSEDIPVTR